MIMNEMFIHFYDELQNATMDNRLKWRPLRLYKNCENLEDCFQTADGMPDFGTNSIKLSGSFFAENPAVGTLFLIEVYHPTTDPVSGQIYLLAWAKDSLHPINLSSLFDVSQAKLRALKIRVENSWCNPDADPEEIRHFINNFLPNNK